ncbi:efflux RND transporter permease subunit [Sporocytophaga myxococcoides]|nr:CusA/CzcA family heavy metal efflux RND transporter [Sporocytophaga myxococcoides]
MNKFLCYIISFSVTHRIFILLMTALMALAGIFSFTRLPIEAFPDVTNTNIIIISQWPGRSAQEIERFVTIPIETEMNIVPKKNTLRSVSLFGLSVVTLIFDDGVTPFEAMTEVSSRLANSDIPDEVVPEIQAPSGPTGEIYRYSLQSKTKDVRELKTIQDWIIDKQLKSVEGVADVVSFGGKVKSFEVILDPHLLAQYNFTAINVYNALKNSNINVGGNVIKSGSEAFVVRGIGLVKNVEDISNIIIENINRVPIKIANVAVVRESYLPQIGIVGLDSLDDIVEGIVLMRKGENPGKVLPDLKKKVKELNELILPDDVKMKVFYDRSTLNKYTLHTVGENVITGITLVTLILFIFLANWRITIIVAIVIPLSLLFAIILMYLKGMRANLLSIGAIDFGIIIDGAVVMTEGIFVVLAHKAYQLGFDKFKKRGKLSWVIQTATEMGKSIFTSKLIIIAALLPIFSFEKVEGKLFSPLAYTIGFALLGAMIISLTLIPMLSYYLIPKDVTEKENFIIKNLLKVYTPLITKTIKHPKRTLIISGAILALALFTFRFVGSEFLPHLNEGSIYVRATMPMSVSLEESYYYTKTFRSIFKEFPEVRGVMSQTGRPNDGTDPTGFFNIEFFVDLYPENEWKRVISKDEIIDAISQRLSRYPGIIFNFSQPIQDNVEEAVSGVKGAIAIKVLGQDLNLLEKSADKVYDVIKNIEGIKDLGVFRNIGQPELKITLDLSKLALYNISTQDCQAALEMAVGGKSISKVFEEEKKFDMVVRYDEEYRYSEKKIANIMVPTLDNVSRIPLKQLADITSETGPAFIYREGNQRFIAIKFSVRGRDLGSTIKEAQEKVNKVLHLPKGYKVVWKGEFENQQRALKRLEFVVPISIFIIFLILYMSFGDVKDSFLILMNVPFSIIGGIFALYITGIHFSISAGVGFIALFGVSVQGGVILVNTFKRNLKEGMELEQAVKEGATRRLRPVVMTALMASLGLLPAAISTGIGSETQKPLAVVVIGGLISSTILDMLNVPSFFNLIYRRKKS